MFNFCGTNFYKSSVVMDYDRTPDFLFSPVSNYLFSNSDFWVTDGLDPKTGSSLTLSRPVFAFESEMSEKLLRLSRLLSLVAIYIGDIGASLPSSSPFIT